MRVAVVGCLHGKLEFLYQELQEWEQRTGLNVDFILCTGDFQSLRDESDLEALECPPKYKELGQFAKYYQKELRAPILTIFIGGNHEASNYLRDLYYGGWAAENIYYLGASGMVQVKKGEESMRVAGISGIEKSYDYLKGYYEKWPYVNNRNNLKSMYHIREFEVQKIKLIEPRGVDMFLSHEWPTVATQKADKESVRRLTNIKPYFKKEIYQGQLGSHAFSDILETVEPKYWFSSHLHVRFQASVKTDKGSTVQFLSLDKPLPKRQYLDVFDLNKDSNNLKSILRNGKPFNPAAEETKDALDSKIDSTSVTLHYDPEWLGILQQTQPMIPLQHSKYDCSGLSREQQDLVERIAAAKAALQQQDLRIDYKDALVYQSYLRIHPQTKEFIDRFGLDARLFSEASGIYQKKEEASAFGLSKGVKAEEEEKERENIQKRTFSAAFEQKEVKDSNEIDLD